MNARRDLRRSLAIAFAALSAARAELTWDRTTIEQTVGPNNEVITLAFGYTNSGRGTVRILNVQPGCGCTTAALDRDVVGPGERGTIKLYFDPKGLSGLQQKTAQVFTDERGTPTLLTLRVTIPELVTITPRLLFWTVGEANQSKAAVIAVAAGTRLNIAGVKSDDPAMDATLATEEAGCRYRLTVTPHSTAKTCHTFVHFEAQVDGSSWRAMSVFAEVY